MSKNYVLKESEHSIQLRILDTLGEQTISVKPDRNGRPRRHKSNLFTSRHGMFWRNNSGVAKTAHGAPIAFGTPGSGDILGIFKGKAIAIEVKTEVGRQSDNQKQWQKHWESRGGIYILARGPKDVWDVLGRL